jgi:type IV secretion system protein VirD4
LAGRIGFHAQPAAVGGEQAVWHRQPTHLATFARTGAGKGTGVCVPAALLHAGPLVVVDPKGEVAAITARARREAGDAVVVLDPMGITGLPAGGFDPLDLVDITHGDAPDEVAALMHLLAGGLRHDPRNLFWTARAEHLVGALVLLVLVEAAVARGRGAAAGAGAATLLRVRELVHRATHEPDEVARRLKACPHPEVQRSAAALQIAARETLGGVLSFAQEMVDFVRGAGVECCLAASTFDIDAVTRGEPLALYLVLPPDKLESHGRLLALWLNGLYVAITRRRTLPARPTLFLVDEAAQLGPLPALRQALTLLRGYGLVTWSIWQDWHQGARLYGEEWPSLLNNCGVVQAFGAMAPAAAEVLADTLGCAPSALRALPRDGLVVLPEGGELQWLRRPDYRSDALFAGRFDANPFHQPAGAAGPALAAGPSARHTAAWQPAPAAAEAGAASGLAARLLQGRSAPGPGR